MMNDVSKLPEFQKFIREVSTHKLFDRDSVVIAAVSGGADSVCMLLFLSAFLPANQIFVAHMNHGIRGIEAERDADFVCKLCEQLGIEFVIESVDVPALSQKFGRGIEETARNCRYGFLEQLAKERKGRIAVAHNQEDRAETILMNLSRGCSVDGLKGIEYKHGNVVRPILNFSRKEIEFVCQHAGVTPMVDSTNLTDCTLRNRVRHEIIPYLSNVFERDMIQKILHLSDQARRDLDFIEKYVAQAMDRLVYTELFQKAIAFRMNVDDFLKEDEGIRYRLIRLILSRMRDEEGKLIYPEGKDLTEETISRIANHVSNGRSGKIAEAGRNLYCRIEHKDAFFFYARERESTEEAQNFNFQVKVEDYINDAISYEEVKSAEIRPYEFFDKDNLLSICESSFREIVLRPAQYDDYFTPFGGKGSTSMRKFFINQKIPLSKRKQVFVVAIGKQVLWIPGIRRGELGRITEKTERIIKITVDAEAMYYE